MQNLSNKEKYYYDYFKTFQFCEISLKLNISGQKVNIWIWQFQSFKEGMIIADTILIFVIDYSWEMYNKL